MRHHYESFKAPAIVNGFLRKRLVSAMFGLAILYEHIIADFHEPAAIAVGVTGGAERRIMRRAQIVKHLRVRTRGTGACFPPIFLSSVEKNPFPYFCVHTCFFELLLPQRNRLIVTRHLIISFKRCYKNPMRRDAHAFWRSQKFKAQRNRGFLEISAKGKVADHFKKSKVRKITHLVNIIGAKTLLYGKNIFPAEIIDRIRNARQIRLELLHTRGGQEHRLVVGYQRRGRHSGMAAIRKKL